MQTVKRQSLIAQVTDQLRGEISSGRWALGERIPTEPELCEMTGTARNTVREAVHSLVHAGLLERRQGSGTYVVATDEQEVAFGDFFATARRSDLLELREALEVNAAGLAAERRDADDVAALRAALDRRNRLWAVAAPDEAQRDEAIASDAQLHRLVVAASHNNVYLEFYDLLVPALRTMISQRHVGAKTSHEGLHTSMVDAVVAGDAEGARTAVRGLLASVGEAG